MNTLSKLSKFFIICAAVVFVGMVCAIAGAVNGGIEDIDKLADNYDWIQGSPGERGVTAQKVEDYHSIEVTGDADVWIVGREFYKKASWLADQEILEPTEYDVIGKNQVCVVCGDKIEQPEIMVENGVLKINAHTAEFNGFSLNLSDTTFTPKILICAPKDVLQSLTVSGETGDVNVLGVSWEDAKIWLNTGDVNMEGVKSGGLSVEIDTGYTGLQGEFMRTTQVSSDTGDVEIDTTLSKAEYALSLKSETGTVEVEEPGEKSFRDETSDGIIEKGGPHKLIAGTDTGEVRVRFER